MCATHLHRCNQEQYPHPHDRRLSRHVMPSVIANNFYGYVISFFTTWNQRLPWRGVMSQISNHWTKPSVENWSRIAFSFFGLTYEVDLFLHLRSPSVYLLPAGGYTRVFFFHLDRFPNKALEPIETNLCCYLAVSHYISWLLVVFFHLNIDIRLKTSSGFKSIGLFSILLAHHMSILLKVTYRHTKSKRLYHI